MDPRLKLIVKGNPNEELHLLMRLKDKNVIPPHIKLISQFGDIISCRILRKYLMVVYDHVATRSLKAPQVIPLNNYSSDINDASEYSNFAGKPRVISKRKSNVVFGIIDFGFDFTHPDFFDPLGNTRFEKIWAQPLKNKTPNKYGYGQVFTQKQIDHALDTATPFRTLGYHPGRGDLLGRGMHGTHVLGIAAATGNIGKKGHAGNSPIVAVDMGSSYVNGSDLSLGDSVKLIEGIDFILEQAGDRPCVINMSLGGHGDAHTGQTLVELALNNALRERAGFAIVQSTGNYFKSKCHHSGKLLQDDENEIEWIFKKRDRTPNEMEIWYEAGDEFAVEIYNDDDEYIGGTEAFEDATLNFDGSKNGIIFHRKSEPNTGKNHINIILAGSPASKRLVVKIIGSKIKNGRYHAYIERDDRGQSHFHESDVNTNHTIGSICNAPLTITVGAYNQASQGKELMSFSSAGPTLDHRTKPEIVAPGSKIPAARSASKFESYASGMLTKKSGSSMAAPFVASLVAKILEQYPKINIYTLRHYLLKFCNPYRTENTTVKNKSGHGVINEKKLLLDLAKKKIQHENTKILRKQKLV